MRPSMCLYFLESLFERKRRMIWAGTAICADIYKVHLVTELRALNNRIAKIYEVILVCQYKLLKVQSMWKWNEHCIYVFTHFLLCLCDPSVHSSIFVERTTTPLTNGIIVSTHNLMNSQGNDWAEKQHCKKKVRKIFHLQKGTTKLPLKYRDKRTLQKDLAYGLAVHEDVSKREALDYFQERLVGFQEAEESYALHITFLQYMSHITNPQRHRMKAHLPQTIATINNRKKGLGALTSEIPRPETRLNASLHHTAKSFCFLFPFQSQSHAWLRFSAWTPFRKHVSFEPATYRSPPSTECGSGVREARLHNQNPTQRAAGFPCSSRNTPLCSPTLVPGHPSSPFRLGGAGASAFFLIVTAEGSSSSPPALTDSPTFPATSSLLWATATEHTSRPIWLSSSYLELSNHDKWGEISLAPQRQG